MEFLDLSMYSDEIEYQIKSVFNFTKKELSMTFKTAIITGIFAFLSILRAIKPDIYLLIADYFLIEIQRMSINSKEFSEKIQNIREFFNV